MGHSAQLISLGENVQSKSKHMRQKIILKHKPKLTAVRNVRRINMTILY